MGKYQGYEKYKDSGVKWLGEIPEHWEAVRLKHITSQIIDAAHFTPTYVDEGIPFLRVTDIVQAKNNCIDMNNIKFIPEEEHKILSIRCKPEKGDLLYSKNGTIGVSRIVDWNFEFSIFVSLCLMKVIKEKVTIEFLQYSLLGKVTETQINIGAKSNTVTNLHLDKIKEFLATIPPLDEQETIARFLDHKTKQIDDLIAKKETLIEKLDEKRTALISHAVTKGLDPSVLMKDSGIEWLAEIPAHWEVKEMKRIVKKGTTITYGIVQAGADIEGGVPYIRTSDMAGDYLPPDGYLRTSHEIDRSYHRSKVITGDIVVAIRATVGKALPVPPYLDGANLTQGTARIAPGDKVEGRFLLWAINSSNSQQRFNALAKGATFREITLDMLRRFIVPIPPLTEQSKISNYLDNETAKIDALITKICEGIEKLKEYRTALITNTVTGKIDVRQVPIP